MLTEPTRIESGFSTVKESVFIRVRLWLIYPMAADPLSRASVLDLLQQLIRIPSVNPTLAPAEAHGEAAIAALSCEWLAADGLQAWLEEAAPGRLNAANAAARGLPWTACITWNAVG